MRLQRLAEFLGLLVALVISSGHVQIQAKEAGLQVDPVGKISFDLGQLNSEGLYGPPDGRRALDYEFCIPADPACEAQVKAIDPTILIYYGSKGRIGCSKEEYLCIGNTHKPEFKKVLLTLAGLPYIKQINQCFFE